MTESDISLRCYLQRYCDERSKIVKKCGTYHIKAKEQGFHLTPITHLESKKLLRKMAQTFA